MNALIKILTYPFQTLWNAIEPQGMFVYFYNTIPGFARINTPKKSWNQERRTITLSNGEEYIIPPYDKMKGHFVLLHDWKVSCKMTGRKWNYTIPKGQSTDFASIPKVLHSLISPLSNSVYAAVLHDYLYRNPDATIAKETTRHEADRMFYFGMKGQGVNPLLALIMYYGVRLGGGSSYKR